LCSIDETTVRQQAVESINLLSKSLSPDQILEHLAPRVLELFEVNEWFTPRVSACALTANAYRGCLRASGKYVNDKPSEMLAKELLDSFVKQCGDYEPMVRRTVALKLGGVVKEFSADAEYSHSQGALLDEYKKLVQTDEQESIRCNALTSAPEVFARVSLDVPESGCAGAGAGSRYKECVHDKSWRVRVALARTLCEVANRCRTSRGSDAEPELKVARQMFISLMEDPEAEVRNASAGNAAAAAAVLGADFAVDHLVPRLTKLVLDETVSNRVDLAGVLLEMAKPLGSAFARAVYLDADETGSGLVKRMLNEVEPTNLRIAIIGKLAALIDVLGIVESDLLLKTIYELCDDKNWRVRHAALTLLPEIAKQMPKADFNATFIPKENPKESSILARAHDNCALIRLDWVRTFASVGESYGSEWLLQQIIPAVRSLEPPTPSLKSADQSNDNYQLRAVVLHAFTELGALLKDTAILEEFFLPAALKMAEDKVVNLRILAAQCLGAVYRASWLGEPHSNKVKNKLEQMIDDKDIDVVEAAKGGLGLS